MASRRFIDRGYWRCRELNKAGARTRLLFIYLFGEEADDFGRVKDDPYLMKRGCFSDEDVTEEDVAAMIETLVDAGLLIRYLARDETPLLWLPTFQDYQPMGYWAKSRLDRHPSDDFEAFDWIGPRNTRVKTPRPLSPMGHEYACAHSPTKSCEVLRNPMESGVNLDPYTYTHTNAVRAGAPVGQRAEPVTTTDKSEDSEASAAKPDSVAAGTAAPDGRGPDAPTIDSDDHEEGHEDNGAFERADDPAAASKVWTMANQEFNVWNGYDPGERLKATAIARGKMLTHEGRVKVLVALFDAVAATKVAPEKRWATFRRRLKGRGGGSAEANRWAKTVTG